MRTSKCFATDGSKMEDKPFVGFALINIKHGRSMKFRIAKIVSTFTAKALPIGETLEIIEKIDLEQNFMIFSDLASVLKGITNSSAVNNTSHITKMLKDKIERLESRGQRSSFTVSRGTADLKFMRGPTWRQSSSSKKAEILN
jgi:hypothetical protein